jgi:hypothetical protein
MYKWYQCSSVCFALLDDVEIPVDWQFYQEHIKTFKRSEWFTRGWTLQELIAPKNLDFYSKSFTLLGEKRELLQILHEVTQIDSYALCNGNVLRFSVARRMFWASKRHTSREEDTAYCLLGLFNINMPLLYGEGKEKAFARLQQEILRESDDQSIFAWFSKERASLLAESPAAFAASGSVAALPFRRETSRNLPTISRRGTGMQFTLAYPTKAEDYLIDYSLLLLDCEWGNVPGMYIGFPVWYSEELQAAVFLAGIDRCIVVFAENDFSAEYGGIDPYSKESLKKKQANIISPKHDQLITFTQVEDERIDVHLVAHYQKLKRVPVILNSELYVTNKQPDYFTITLHPSNSYLLYEFESSFDGLWESSNQRISFFFTPSDPAVPALGEFSLKFPTKQRTISIKLWYYRLNDGYMKIWLKCDSSNVWENSAEVFQLFGRQKDDYAEQGGCQALDMAISLRKLRKARHSLLALHIKPFSQIDSS